MDGGITLFLFAAIAVLYIFMRIGNLAEESRKNSIREEAVREIIRRHKQKIKIDELYGRTPPRETKDENWRSR